MKRKLSVPLFAASLSAVPLALTAVACGNTQNKAADADKDIVSQLLDADNKWTDNAIKPTDASVSDTLAQRGIFKMYISSERQPIASYFLDRSIGYGGYTGSSRENVASPLIRTETMLRPYVIDSNGLKIVRPSIWRYKLEYGSKVVVTTKDNQVHTFDNDEYDVYPEAEGTVSVNGKNVEYYSRILYQVGSNNARSINSKAFEDVLANAKKLQIVVRPGLKWLTQSGTETNYDVTADDYYISWLRTAYLSSGTRAEALGKAWGSQSLTHEQILAKAAKLDSDANSLLETGSRYFTEGQEYPNEYLFSLYNIKSEDFYERDKFITQVDGQDALTFNVSNENEQAYFKDLFAQIANDQTFLAAPSKYIAEKAKNFTIKPFQEGKTAELQSLYDTVKALPEDNPIVKAGIYWYGINYEDTLLSGRYLFGGYDSGSQTEKWVKNEKYFDAQNTKTKEYQLKYKNQTDDNQYKSVLYNEYSRGLVSRINPNDLNEKDRLEAGKNRKTIGEYYTKYYNTNSSAYTMMPLILPKTFEIPKDSGVDSFNFNENYSKLVYGMSRQEIIDGSQKGEDFYTKIFAGNGLVFRTLVNAAINWEQVASTVSDGMSKSWVSGYAPDALIGASDSKDLTTVDKYQEISGLFALDSNLNRLQLNGGVSSITPAMNAELITDLQDDALRIRSYGYDQIKKQITALLDKFYADNNIPETQKIEWVVPFRYINYNPVTYKDLFENVVPNLVRSLDEKGRLAPSYQKYNEGKELWKNVQQFSSVQLAGWGYDVNSMGSGIDGFLNSAQLNIILGVVGNSEKIAQKLQPAFPELVKLAKEYAKFAQTSTDLTGGVPVSMFKDIDLRTLSAFRKNYERYKVDNGQVVTTLTPVHASLSTATTKFIVAYASKLSTDEVIKLANEISNYVGPLIDTERRIPKDFTLSFVNPYVNFPYFGVNALWFSDISYANDSVK
ncbi:OppA family ABC transporter substrate-binding lipoprotein [Mycoplasmopsis felifaucium]|uniref:OppA family ABC transporter substrate-binding lipoprotein n=1 Tax=Mycoplasmopsis felifaucium TaxID=35768 RepID=UPI000488CC6D|nr:hypothetical protein [Mycoplasmopsis felifaucium]